MQVQWTFEGCANATKEKCRTYWYKKQERLERILSGIPFGSRKLRIAVFNHRNKIEQFEARGVLNLPGRSLAIQFSHADLFAVLDGLSDKLVAAAKKFKERSSRVVRESRKQQIAEDLFAAESLLAWDVKADRKKSFFSILRPLLEYIERKARSELKIFELESILSPGQVDPGELVDEVVLLAWERFSERPKDLPMEFWLIRLLQEVLDKVEWEHQFVSLDQTVPLVEIDSTSTPDWYEEVLGYQEELTLAELIPDSVETEGWEQLDEMGRNLHVYSVLQKLPSYQRQAYILHTIDEYSAEEISRIQDRPVTEVETDISKSRTAMNKYMKRTGMIK